MFLSQVSKKILSSVMLTLFISSTITVANANPGERRGPPGAPPEEAITACASLSEGEACSFTTSNGDAIEGSCKAAPRGDGPLACAPAGGPPNQQNRQQ